MILGIIGLGQVRNQAFNDCLIPETLTFERVTTANRMQLLAGLVQDHPIEAESAL